MQEATDELQIAISKYVKARYKDAGEPERMVSDWLVITSSISMESYDGNTHYHMKTCPDQAVHKTAGLLDWGKLVVWEPA